MGRIIETTFCSLRLRDRARKLQHHHSPCFVRGPFDFFVVVVVVELISADNGRILMCCSNIIAIREGVARLARQLFTALCVCPMITIQHRVFRNPARRMGIGVFDFINESISRRNFATNYPCQ